MSWSEAEDLVIGVLYQNSNDLYKLGLPQRVRGQLGSISAVHGIRAQPSVNDQLQILEEYLEKDSSIQYLRVYWNDMTGTTRMRGTPVDYV
ncbi:hypothetical protein IMZ48_36605, partial [Candidatus Bathyarchaeota archaeon]|nr:hypothetical protein [Candidatus Bathyarchaeota archaeon]